MVKSLKIVSFNLRYLWEGDGINSFVKRGPFIVDKIKSVQPEVIGFQEATDKNIGYLRNKLPEYEFVFNQREKDMKGEGVALAYLRGEMTLLSCTFFWLSDTPHISGTRYKGQDGCPRVCQCAMLRRESDRKIIRVYNTHLDHVSEYSRVKGIGQILERAIEEQEFVTKSPVFIMGDFNALPNSEAIQYCNEFKILPLVDTTADIPFTFHGFGNTEAREKIDYIYTDAKTANNPYKAQCWADEKEGVYLSDHYPVELEVILED